LTEKTPIVNSEYIGIPLAAFLGGFFMPSYYEILSVRPDATVDEIDKAYRNLAQQLHPDRNRGSEQSAATRFKRLERIFRTLKDPRSRFAYNEARCRVQNGWFFVPMDAELDQFQFLADGRFVILGRTFSLAEPIEAALCDHGGTRIGEISKKPGPEHELTVHVPGCTRRFRFHQGRWYAWSPPEFMAAATEDEEGASFSTQLVPTNARFSGSNGSSAPPPPSGSVSPPPVAGDDRTPLSRLRYSAMLAVVAAVLLIAGVAGGYYISNKSDGPVVVTPEQKVAAREREANELDADLAALDVRIQEAQTNAERRRQALAELQNAHNTERELAAQQEQSKQHSALVKSRLAEIKRHAVDVLQRHSELVSEAEAWHRLQAELLTNEAGRRLATKTDNVRTFLKERGKPWPAVDTVKAIAADIQTLIAPIDAALAEPSPAYQPGPELAQRLEELRGQIENQLQTFRGARQLIEALVAASPIPGAKILETVIADLARTDAEETKKVVDRETAEIREKENQEEAERKKRAIAGDIERKRQEEDAEREAALAKQERDKLIKESKSANVQNALAFFFERGFLQPTAGSYVIEGKLRPYSLSKLRAAGALEPGDAGLNVLLGCVTSRHDTERTKWNMVSSLSQITGSQRKQLITAQDYLNKYGKVLVDQGQLAP
jgi:hypothetical protein